MKLINTSSKIINIGQTALLPDNDIAVNEAVVNSPSIKILVSMGFLKVIEEAPVAPAVVEEAHEEAVVKEEKKPVRRTAKAE